MWDDLGDYVKKTVAAHHGCIKEHYAGLEQAAERVCMICLLRGSGVGR